MNSYQGDYGLNAIVYLPFTTHDKDGGAIAPSTAFETADVKLFKNGSTERGNVAGYTMTSPLGGIVGLHLLAVDTADNTVAGFFAAGGEYFAALSPDTETIDTEIALAVIGSFSIERANGALARLKAVPKVDVETIKTQAVTCSAGVTMLASVGAPAAPGASGGLPTTNGTKLNQTVDLTAGQTIAATVAGSVGSITGVTFPANFEHLAITDTTGLVDITQTAADKAWATAARVLTASTNLAGVEVDVTKIHGTALSETGAGYIAGSFTKFFDKQTPTGTINSLPDAVAGANGGLPTTNGTKVSQTVDLTGGQTIAATVADKAGYSLSATGADLILKSSTFVQAIVAAVNEFATYGLTALNTLLVTTGIKAASVPAVTVTTNNDKTGYALSATGADAIAKTSTFALAIADAIWEETVRTLSANTNLANLEVDLTKIHGTAITETAGQIAAAFTKLFDVAIPVLTCESVNQAQDNATTAEIKTAVEAAGGTLALSKTILDKVDNMIEVVP